MPISVLIVEDERLIRWSIRQKLEEIGYAVSEADCGTAAVQSLNNDVFDVILLDHKLPDTTGLDILRNHQNRSGDTVVIMMTAYSGVEDAVEAIKLGAFDYISKPFDMPLLLLTIEKGLETTRLRREVRALQEQQHQRFGGDRIIGQHPSMQQLFDMINKISQSGASTIFLRGETGTGKDLVARVIHHNSDRASAPFTNITCTAISESLLESELFGHERGAFTDAKTQKKGLFEIADGGTVFLDEVGDMPLGLQAKLLRFLEERIFRRVGGTKEISVDVRVIAATNCDLEQAIRDGRFRQDLLFRLNVVPIYLPPLRERGEDIHHLATYFVMTFAQEFKKRITSIDDASMAKLKEYSWPGNVREIRNVCERAVLLCKSDVLYPGDVIVGRSQHPATTAAELFYTLPPGGVDFFDLEEHLLKQSLAKTNSNQTQAAKLLKLSRDTFRYRLEKHGLL